MQLLKVARDRPGADLQGSIERELKAERADFVSHPSGWTSKALQLEPA
jgi:hypothetical protein